jgi:ribosomal protein L37E
MVQIVGEDPTAKKKVTCRNCGAILEYTPHEVKVRHGTDYSGGSDGEEWVDCPRCGKKAIINSW